MLVLAIGGSESGGRHAQLEVVGEGRTAAVWFGAVAHSGASYGDTQRAR